MLPLSWVNVSFLSATHIVAVGGLIAYLAGHGLSWPALALGLVWTALTIFSLSAGYHRLFSHRAYEAHPLMRLFLLVFGAATFQNSALVWAADHRRHHKRVDSPLDPYDARQGFWHSHIGWVLRQTPPATELHPVPDLERDRLVMWQHRFYPLIGGAAGFGLPALLGAAMGDFWGGLVMAGPVRLVLVYHITFSINSLAHMLGRQPYSDRNTSRDSFLSALVSMGEGYHNFHHTFPADYRNGVRSHHFDPSKWAIRLLAAVGLTRNLKRTPPEAVIRARVRMEALRARRRAIPAALRERLDHLQHVLEQKLEQWRALRARLEAGRAQRQRDVLRRLRAELRGARMSFHRSYRDWRQLVRWTELAPLAEG